MILSAYQLVKSNDDSHMVILLGILCKPCTLVEIKRNVGAQNGNQMKWISNTDAYDHPLTHSSSHLDGGTLGYVSSRSEAHVGVLLIPIIYACSFNGDIYKNTIMFWWVQPK